ncbi:hypothetical protein [Bacteroides fragilis]|uniref:hypothetical protein n=1 Tax=Bacteroides fragilis TaxID=817 RepID=UPI001E374AD9|nr:hypothetical protein [Bacteroides fragilis]
MDAHQVEGVAQLARCGVRSVVRVCEYIVVGDKPRSGGTLHVGVTAFPGGFVNVRQEFTYRRVYVVCVAEETDNVVFYQRVFLLPAPFGMYLLCDFLTERPFRNILPVAVLFQYRIGA